MGLGESEPFIRRAVAVERCRAREAFWRKKANEDLDVNPDTALIRADECRMLAEILDGVSPDYYAPAEPRLRSERRARRA